MINDILNGFHFINIMKKRFNCRYLRYLINSNINSVNQIQVVDIKCNLKLVMNLPEFKEFIFFLILRKKVKDDKYILKIEFRNM